jgi:hypothetical protein
MRRRRKENRLAADGSPYPFKAEAWQLLSSSTESEEGWTTKWGMIAKKGNKKEPDSREEEKSPVLFVVEKENLM